MLSPETKKTPGKLGSPSHLSYMRLIEEVSRDYYWVRFCMRFSRGIAETYHRSLRKCEEENWCSYLMFVEDDWMFEYTNIKHSAMELLALCQDTNWATETFQQVSATSCQNDQGRSPRVHRLRLTQP
ncbi:hypothetical protein WJX82_005938 [Trebouxia sp. C0006]